MNGSLLLMGLSGPDLTADEERLALEIQPVGFLWEGVESGGVMAVRALGERLRRICGRQPVVAVTVTVAGKLALADGGPELPGAAELAAAGDARAIRTAGMLTGELLRLIGINLCLGPVLDLAEPGGAEGAWGSDPQRVIDHAGQWNRWLRKRGVASCAGRFPAGNSARSDGGADSLQLGPLLPYTALMPELDAIRIGSGEMAGIDAGLPATLAAGVVRRLLRDRLGFDHHCVISADLGTGEIARRFPPGVAARMALEAGCDVVSAGSGAAAEVSAALAEVPFPVRAEAWERVERLRDRLHWPLPWSDEKWRDWLAKARDLADRTR